MKPKQFNLDNDLVISVYKRSSSRRIRLSIGGDGSVKVSIPKYMPYSSGLAFAKSKLAWIKQKRPEPTMYRAGMQIGKSYRLVLKETPSKTVSTRIIGQEAVVYLPKSLSLSSEITQTAIKRLIRRALTIEAKQLLPIRLKQLAEHHGYSYSGLSIKPLKTRWGSCDQSRHITLNIYLMQLPWELIDYVLLHELNHTEIMRHGQPFWDSMALKNPSTHELKSRLKKHPILV